jgi:hypothetical protein
MLTNTDKVNMKTQKKPVLIAKKLSSEIHRLSLSVFALSSNIQGHNSRQIKFPAKDTPIHHSSFVTREA